MKTISFAALAILCIACHDDAWSDHTIRLGKTATVELASPFASGGYFWVCTNLDAATIQVIDQQYVSTNGLPGGPKKEIWTLEGRKAGHYTLHLEYRRFGVQIPADSIADLRITVLPL